MPVLDQKVEAEVVATPTPEDSQPKQRRRMLIALALLLASLIVVAAKNWSFWSQYFFPADASSQADQADDSSTEITTEAPAKTIPQASPSSAKSKAKKHKQVSEPAPAASGPVVTATNRAVLPPLQVEVVAGNNRRPVHTSSNSIKVDMQPEAPAESAAPANPNASQATIVASDRVKISPDAAQVISRPVRPNYPLLARQMKVEGAVVLQALIGKEGSIQDLRVVSGPEILSAAARQAVTQWHFKPYYQDGQAVETEARITVNFTISTN